MQNMGDNVTLLNQSISMMNKTLYKIINENPPNTYDSSLIAESDTNIINDACR